MHKRFYEYVELKWGLTCTWYHYNEMNAVHCHCLATSEQMCFLVDTTLPENLFLNGDKGIIYYEKPGEQPKWLKTKPKNLVYTHLYVYVHMYIYVDTHTQPTILKFSTVSVWSCSTEIFIINVYFFF